MFKHAIKEFLSPVKIWSDELKTLTKDVQVLDRKGPGVETVQYGVELWPPVWIILVEASGSVSEESLRSILLAACSTAGDEESLECPTRNCDLDKQQTAGIFSSAFSVGKVRWIGMTESMDVTVERMSGGLLTWPVDSSGTHLTFWLMISSPVAGSTPEKEWLSTIVGFAPHTVIRPGYRQSDTLIGNCLHSTEISTSATRTNIRSGRTIGMLCSNTIAETVENLALSVLDVLRGTAEFFGRIASMSPASCRLCAVTETVLKLPEVE